MEPKETWEEIASRTAVDFFLKALDLKMDSLRQEIKDIYPQLGEQVYRHKDRPSADVIPWVVEQHLIEIKNRDAEIYRLRELSNSIIAEIRKMEQAA